MSYSAVCFGEILLRFNTLGQKRISQLGQFEISTAGAEANVASALSQLGIKTKMVSTIPNNSLGKGVISSLKSFGVDTSLIQKRDGRLGQYFHENGAVKRPFRLEHDIDNTAFSRTPATSYNWRKILSNASLLHISGTTAAVSPSAETSVKSAMNTARSINIETSFDSGFKDALWQKSPRADSDTLEYLLSQSTIAFINKRDLELIFKEEFISLEKAAHKAFSEFPQLHTIACIGCTQHSTVKQTLTSELFRRDEKWASPPQKLTGIIDNIGGGDAFAAGILFGIAKVLPAQAIIDFATATSVIKHSTPGDALISDQDEVIEMISSSNFDIIR